jgi:membrane fusion protein (multidrug efflux system)
LRIYDSFGKALCYFILVTPILLSGCSQGEDPSAQNSVRQEKVVPVEVEPVVAEDMTEAFTLPASLEAWEDLILAAEIAGPVKKVHFKEGDRVKPGEVLLEIDPDTIQSYLRRDQDNVDVLERKLRRYRKLEQDGLVSRQEVDDLENTLTAAESSLTTTRLQLAKSRPQAPIGGFLDRIYVDRGEYVDPGKPLVRLVQVERLKVIADVPEKDVRFLAEGQAVEIEPAVINGASKLRLQGTISSIAYAADEITRTYRTQINIDNPDKQLRPGMIVRAHFVRRRLQNVISVPLYAVIDRNNEQFVFVAEGGVAQQRKVSIGTTIGQRILVEKGLAEGDALIVRGHRLLNDGSKISTGP